MTFDNLTPQRALRRMRIGTCLLISLAAALACPSGDARDLSRNDPDRAAILDAARGDPQVRLVVKDLARWNDLAYLCALKQEGTGEYLRTDDAIKVYRYALVRAPAGWTPVEIGGGFAADAAHVDCTIDDQAVTPDNLGGFIADAVKSTVLDSLDYGRLNTDADDLLKLLAHKKLLDDFSIEHDKSAYSADQAAISRTACGNAEACKKKIGQAYDFLTKMRTDPAVSSLIWANCNYGLRVSNLALVAACVDKTKALPQCRPNQRFNADRENITQCIGSLKRQCRADLGEQGPCN